MTKAALSLSELTELWVPELDHVDVIEQDQRMILHAKSDVERGADGMLARGMENQNQNQVRLIQSSKSPLFSFSVVQYIDHFFRWGSPSRCSRTWASLRASWTERWSPL